MSGEDNACTAVHAGKFLDRNGVAQGIKTGAAVLLRIGNAHPAELTHFPDSLFGKFVVLIQKECEGLDLLLRKTPDLRAQLLVRRRGLK